MEAYMIFGLIINFFVSFILFMAVRPLSARYALRSLISAAIGSALSALSLLPGFPFGGWWHAAVQLLICLTAFGISMQSLRETALFCLLRLALEGMGDSGPWGIVWSVALYGVYRFVFRSDREQYVPVEIRDDSKQVNCSALRDTGHRLWDPITGKRVLVVDAEVAECLTGLKRPQLSQPLQTMGTLPGLRLIPYRSVGGTGLLLAKQYSRVTIGTWQGDILVAFSPEILDRKGTYQALIGGTV